MLAAPDLKDYEKATKYLTDLQNDVAFDIVADEDFGILREIGLLLCKDLLLLTGLVELKYKPG
ncbi:hypothetical protein MUK42_14626 [Musa troglodytarum]|uniref:Uncharacterized protein n=1 Tax=Musa troglodytarum TaxID=320322 RepID=A0A9E7I7T1_9LILI|nr:hypothetical protein MUK42_14626 [Musa troglodytarum]